MIIIMITLHVNECLSGLSGCTTYNQLFSDAQLRY